METGDRIWLRDDKLLKNENSWRRARVGAILLTIVWVICFWIADRTDSDLESELKRSLILWICFWIVVIDWLNLRISHIESIKYYRNRLSSPGLGGNEFSLDVLVPAGKASGGIRQSAPRTADYGCNAFSRHERERWRKSSSGSMANSASI